jgi:hypothetical protein
MISVEKYRGGGGMMIGSAVVGVLGLVLTWVGYAASSDPLAQRMHMASYLIAFAYWVGIAIAATIWIAIFFAAKARWVVVVRRGLESISTTLPLFVLLVIPILLGLGVLFSWVHPAPNLTAEQAHLLAHKHPYLNPTAFIVRAAIYFLVWIGVSQALHGWSTRQDEVGDINLTARMRRVGAGSIPFLGITITFAGFDWLMSLDPYWGSTIFGALYFAGSFLAAMAVLTIYASQARGPHTFGSLLTKEHYHNLGKLMFAFTVFWAYISFSQFLLIWIANIPEEGAWYVVRMRGAWTPVGILVAVCQFAIPFIVLLSRDIKYSPRALTVIAVWILAAHYLDLYWLCMPALSPNAVPAQWTDLTAFLGVGGLTVAFMIFRLRGKYTVPVKDPYLADSLRYINP